MDIELRLSAYQPSMPSAAEIAALRSALLDSPQELDRIANLTRADALCAMHAFAAGCGLGLSLEALANFLHPDPLGLDRVAPSRITGDTPPSGWWLPTSLGTDGAQMTVEWAHFGTAPLDEPFFEEPLRRARQHPVSRLFRWTTPLASLADAAPHEGRGLDGIVFHMSRCGSTLVAQTLAAMPGHVVLSEPAPFDAVLQFCAAHTDVAFPTRIAHLRGMIGALAGTRGESVRRRFLKADCWHVGVLPLIRAAFPDTPWIFLYRDPREVLISQERMPGFQTLPGPPAALVGVDEPDSLPGLDFTARVLAATCHKAADHAAIGGGIFVDYAQLPGALDARILPHFGIDPDPAERAAIAATLSRDAKEPFKRFDPRERAPRQSASPGVIAASDRHLVAAVERLRELDQRPLG